MRLISLVAITVLVCACGGGSAPMQSEKNLRTLPTAVMQQKSIAYSPFRTANRDNESITKLMIQEDLGLLQQAGFGLIRLFDSTDEVAKQTLEVIRDSKLPIKVMLGMYLNPNAEQSNQTELQRGIKLAADHGDTVVALSVGNETMVSWSFVPIETSDMARYLRQVRAAVNQPVTTNDNWAFFANTQGVKPPTDVLANIDFVAMHTYPLMDTIHNPQLWNWQQINVPEGQRAQAMMDAALTRVQFEYQAVRQHLNASGHAALPIMIGETGWKAEPSSNETLRAHPVNQKMYFERLEDWKNSGDGPVTVVHFDEPWKKGDDKWGLFDVQRRARCAAQPLNAQLAPAPGSCDATQAQYFKPNTNTGPVTAAQFTVYAEVNTSGETRPDVLPLLNAWENGTTANASEVNESSGDGSKSLQINPLPASWGWGMTWSVTGVDTDLSNFTSSTARLNFRIKTTYPGKLEIGFLTGATTDRTARDVYLPIAAGDYGYQNDGAWHQVSVPVSALIAHGAPAFNMPTTAVLQMNRVSNLFVIADRYDKTGKAQNANVTTPILVDGIRWTR